PGRFSDLWVFSYPCPSVFIRGWIILVAASPRCAVSRVSKPAGGTTSHAPPIWKSAIQQVWKPALRRAVAPLENLRRKIKLSRLWCCRARLTLSDGGQGATRQRRRPPTVAFYWVFCGQGSADAACKTQRREAAGDEFAHDGNFALLQQRDGLGRVRCDARFGGIPIHQGQVVV